MAVISDSAFGRHPIRVVARRTGLKPDLIRAWERRYEAVVPERDDDNRRTYSDEDIERLVLLRSAVEAGRTIGAVARLDTDELRRLAAEDQTPAGGGDADQTPKLQELAAAAVETLDSRRLHDHLAHATRLLGAAEAIETVIRPLVEDLTRFDPLQRSAARTVIRIHLDGILERSWDRADSSPTGLLVRAAEPSSELEALQAAAIAAADGWQVTLLENPEAVALTGHAAESLRELPVLLVGQDPQLSAQLTQLDRGLVLSDQPPAAPLPARTRWVARDRLRPALQRLWSRIGRGDAVHHHPHGEAQHTATPELVLHLGPTLPVADDRPLPRTTAGDLAVGRLEDARGAADLINRERPANQGVGAGQLLATAVLHDFGHRLIGRYCREHRLPAMDRALDRLEDRLGEVAVERGLDLLRPYLGAAGATPVGATPELLEEALLLHVALTNPALGPVRRALWPEVGEAAAPLNALAQPLRESLTELPRVGPDRLDLLAALELPAREHPHSLAGQLELVVRLEGVLSGPAVDRLLLALDVLREETAPAFGPAPDPTPPPPPGAATAFSRGAGPDHYSADTDWMRGLVVAARHTLVWLDQLTSRHRRPIRRLDEIPDEELARLAGHGVTGLWLVGLWQRSRASARIKALLGQPDAAASAYAIADYVVADELGGEAALARLAERAAGYGLRLGGDLVANHTGLDSSWLLEHPERFLALPESPFPVYRFTGEDLSPDPRVAIHLADQYLDRSDAPVVFRRIDRATGEVRYVYHGNDGTALPWNDTAQLDYLKPETRDAMASTIVEVARRLPILRLDAAMTLVRSHVQRLWYPRPGHGGAIPSRAGHGIGADDFDRLMPREFWREVAERVHAEAPGTMLLAEAFWMMEATFVRELGAHRVYNSAFMHHLRDEENDRFRQALAGALEVGPEVVARHVNFLTTPDERSAAEQFGAGDKYFGACALMAVMPGTPLLGHGQLEGLAERYGMEFRRATTDERPDQELERRHLQTIAPLLRRRQRFAGCDGFALLESDLELGRPDDVIGFVNHLSSSPVVVCFHNRAARARGRILRTSATRSQPATPLADALRLAPGEARRFRDALSGRETTVTARGLELNLGPYEIVVLEAV